MVKEYILDVGGVVDVAIISETRHVQRVDMVQHQS
jgi:hypothetical protein